MAVEITNAKVQRPSVNAIENLVIHQDVAQEYLPAIADELQKYVELRGDEKPRILEIKQL